MAGLTKGSRRSPGYEEYLWTISLATRFRGTTTVLVFSLIVLVGMYSSEPFTTSLFLSLTRSPTLQPTLHWNTKMSFCTDSL